MYSNIKQGILFYVYHYWKCYWFHTNPYWKLPQITENWSLHWWHMQHSVGRQACINQVIKYKELRTVLSALLISVHEGQKWFVICMNVVSFSQSKVCCLTITSHSTSNLVLSSLNLEIYLVIGSFLPYSWWELGVVPGTTRHWNKSKFVRKHTSF